MDKILPSHLSTQEINYYNLDTQYQHWISQLRFLDEEFSFYIQLASSKELRDVNIDATLIAEKIPTVQKENQVMLDKVINYRNQLESLRECEDIACDTFYLNDHQHFKTELEQHVERMRNFKRSIFRTFTLKIV